MRTRHVCPKCSHNRILLIAQVPERTANNILVPMHVATIVSGQTFMGHDKEGSGGVLSAAVCRACGHTEFQVLEPATIPVDGRLVREVVGPTT